MFVACALLFTALASVSSAQTIYDWFNTAPDGNWKQGAGGARWTGGLWDEPPSGNILRFNNDNQRTMNNNITGYTYSVHQIIFGSSSTLSRSIGGNAINVNDWGGADPKIQNDSSASHSISLNITGDATSTDPLELNPVSGDLTISGTINNNGSGINVYGNNDKMLTLSGIVSGSGKLIIHQNSKVKISAASTYSGASEINAGELWFATGGSANSSTIWVGNGGALGTTAKLWIESGGTTISSPINVNNGNANTRVVGGLNTSGTVTYSGAVDISRGDVNLEAASGGTVDFTGAITTGSTSSKYITKVGSGLVTFSGSGNNSFIGANVNAGTLRLAKNSSSTVRALNSSPIVNSGGTLQLGGSGGDQMPDSSFTVDVRSGGVFDMNGLSETVGAVSLNGTGISSGGALINNAGTASTLTGAITLGSEAWIGGNGSLTIASAIGETGGARNIVKVGSGTTRFSTGNTYTGITYINNGTLRLSSSTQGGNYEIGNISGSDSAALNLDGGLTLSRTVTVRSGSSGAMFLANTADTSGTATYSGNLTLSSNKALTLYANTGGAVTLSGTTISLGGAQLTVDGNGGSATISGQITGTSGTVVKNGASTTLTLSGANSFTGAVTINSGVINAQNATALGTTAGGVTVASGAALQIQGGITIGAEALGLSGTGISTDGALRNISGANTYQGAITLNAATRINSDAGTLTLDVASGNAIAGTHNLTFGGNGNVTVSDPIATSTGTLTKDGNGTLLLGAANTYTGTTTINAGTLQINGSNRISDSSAVTLAGGTLQASGTATDTMGALTVSSTGTIDMGSGDADLTFASLTSIGTSLAVNNWTVGTDTITFTSAGNLTEANLDKITVNGGKAGVSSGQLIAATAASAPTNVAVTSGQAQLTVSFAAPSSNGGRAITNYEYSTNGGSNWTAVSPASTSTSITISGLANGTSYDVQVRAVTAFGSGTASGTVAASTFSVPAAPTITSISAGDKQLSVNFTAGSDGGSAITNYQYSTDGGSNWRNRATGTTASPLVITTISGPANTELVNGQSYNVRIRAVNAVGNGAETATTSATPVAAATVPEAPTSLVVTPGDQQLSIAFTPGSDGGAAITNYEYSFNNSTWTAFDPVDTVTPVVITGLTNGTAYTVYLRARNSVGPGTASSSASGTPRTTPGAPTLGTITPGNAQLSVAFTAPTSTGGADITDYEYSTDNGTSYKAAGSTTSPLTLTTVSGSSAALVNGTTYTILLRAVNAAGSGTASSSGTGTPRTTPSAPTSLVATPGNGELSIAFTAGSDGGSAITNYEYSLNNSTWTALNPVDTTTPVTIPGLTNGTAYTVYLRAVNAAGSGAGSSGVSGTPRTTPGAPTIGTITPGNGQLSVAFSAPASDGGSAITDYKWSVDGATYTTRAGTASPIVITGLNNGTAYTVRIRAVNSAGDGLVATAGSTATPVTSPTVTTGSASGVGSTVATLGGNITALGGTATATERGIFYSTTSGFADGTGTKVSSTGSFGTGAFTQSVSGLAKNTTYYFKAFAVNSAGTSYGSQGTFTTVNVPDGRNPINNTLPTTAFVGDMLDLYIRAWQSWSSVNRSFATVFGRFDNTDLTSNTIEGTGRDPGSADADFYAPTPRFTQAGTFYWAMRVSYGVNANFFFDRTMADWLPLATTLPSAATLNIVVSALNPPSGQNATPVSGNQIDLGWTRGNSGGLKNTVIFRSTSNTAPTLSGNTAYTANTDYTNLGGGITYRCIYNGSGTSHNDTGLTAGTQYYYYFFAVNNNYYSATATANATTSANYVYDVPANTQDTVATTLTGSGSLTKSGSGTLVLTATDSSYAGGTLISNGTLLINNDRALGAVPSTATANSITISNATLGLNGTITLAANRGITLTGNAVIDDWGNGGDIYNGIIASSGTTSLTKEGGGTLTLGGNNTYTGLTTVNNGTLTITHASALGAVGTGNGTTVTSGDGLILSGNISVGSELLTINGVGPVVSSVDTGALRSAANSTTSWNGAITLGSNARINADSGGTLTLSGGVAAGNNVLFIGDVGNVVIDSQISGAGATQDGTTTSLYKSGDGTLTLSAANTYTGDTRISRGRVVANAAGSLGTGSGADVRIALNGALTVSNNVTVASVREWAKDNGGTVTIATGATLTLNGANKGEHFQNSIGGAGGLTMSGSGTTQLSLYGTQSYTGTTTVTSGAISTSVEMSTANVVINGGTFFIASGGDIASANVTLGSGGTLDITGPNTGRALGTGKVLTASATGANTTATVRTGDSTAKSYSLGSGELAFSQYGGGATAPLTVSGSGNFDLNSRAVSVTSATQLAAGTYKLIAKSGTANVTGAPASANITVGSPGSVGPATLAVTSGELILTVAKGTPTITTAPSATAITYGQTLASSTLSGGVGSVPGTFAFTTSSTAPNAGTQSVSVTFTPTDTANYNTVTTNINITVNAVSLPTVTFTAPASLVYNRTAKTYSASASGVPLTLTYTGRNSTSYGPSTTAPTNVGDYTVTASTSDTNYSGSQAENFSITAKGITGSFVAASKEYDGNTTAIVTERSLTGVETGDTVTLEGGTATFADANAGTGKTVTLIDASLTGAAASNYSLTSVATTTANITKATPTITTAPTATAISVGQALSASTLSGGVATGVGGSVLGGAFAFTSPETTPGVGTANQSVTFTPTDTTNYNTATTSASVTVNSSIPVVTASTFSGTVGVAFNQSISATGSPTSYAITSGTLPAGLSLNATNGAITGTPTAAVSGVTVQVTATNSNGTSEAATITFNIAKGSSTVAVTGSTIFTYNGSAQGPATVSSSGSTGAVTFSYSGSGFGPSATPPTNVGSYSVTATLAEDANYNGATSDPQVFSITAASLPSTTFTQGANGVFTASAPGVTNWNYLYVGRTNIPGLNTNSYAFLTYSNTNAPTAPGFYTVTATSADPNFTGSTNEHYAISGPLSKLIEVTKVQGTTNARFNRTTMLGTVQRVDTNGVLHTGVTNLVWTNGTIGGLSQMPNGYDPMTMSNTVTFDNIVVRLTPPGNGASLTDSFTLRVTDGHTPVDFPVTVTSTALPPFELQARRMIPNGDGTMTAIFVTRPNRNIEMMFRTNIASTNWAYVTSTSNVVQVGEGLQPQTLVDEHNQPRGTNIPTGQSGVIQLKVPAGGQMFFRARQVTP